MTRAIPLLLLLAAPAAAHDPAPGHSEHGEAFREGPRQAAKLLGGTGRVRFPVTTANPTVQALVDQGVGQLHGFWYFEAERSFRQAAALDPDCAAAYWGMALANVNNRQRAEGFIAAAVKRNDKASPREKRWIEAYSTFWTTKKPEKDARQDLVRALEDIAVDFPDMLEAKSFVLYHLWDNSGKGVPITSKLATEALARDLFVAEPLHPAHHYVIHLWDGEKPARALESAARCGPAAPNVAHMWHMPGHTYSKLKRYADAAYQQEASARVDHKHMRDTRLLPDRIHNYAHNNQWLSQTLAHLGRVREARDVARNLIELPRHPAYNTLAKGESSSSSGRRRLFEALARYEQWGDLITLAADGGPLEATDVPAERIKRLRLLGVAHFSRGDADAGRGVIAQLHAHAETRKGERVAVAGLVGGGLFAGRAPRPDGCDAALAELAAWECLHRPDLIAATNALDAATDIPADRAARLRLMVGDRERAEKLARDFAKDGAGQVDRQALLVEVLEAVGKRKEAVEAFAAMREVAGHADRELPVFARLAPLAKELKFAADWRLPKPPAKDLGERPALATLGPLAWEPWAAPEFRVALAGGKSASLADYRGRPVLILATLGFGCSHCVGQLKAFAAKKSEFDGAGIELLGVGIDDEDALAEACADGGAGAGLPFPVAADPAEAFFRQFGAYDDFEGRPLHGAYLVGADGRVLWWDVGHEPFTDAGFVLAEAKRLRRAWVDQK